MIDDHTPQQMAMQQLQGSGNCICQEQHRRGYCTEPGCSYNCKKAADRIEALEAALRDCNGLFAKIIEQRVRIEALEAALRELLELHDSDHQTGYDVEVVKFIRAALAPEQDK